MLAALLGEAPELQPLTKLIAERTEGNPFFMEEMVQSLFEQGVLSRNGTVRLVKPISEMRVPPTVRGVLASRIDRLPTAQKELLQTLAVVGRRFPVSLARRVAASPEDDIAQSLVGLQIAEFLYEQPSLTDVEFSFKHALTQEVAYNSLLIEQRRVVHERVARAIEDLYEKRIEEHVAELAHHYRHTGNIEKAVQYLRRAAEYAAARSAMSEAEAQLRDAIGLSAALPSSPERDLLELDLQRMLSGLLTSRSFGAAEKEDPLRRARELCERVANPRNVLLALFQLGQFYIQRRRLSEARELAERALALAEGAGGVEPLLEMGVWYNVAESSFWFGEFRKSIRHVDRAFALCRDISPESLIHAYSVDWWLAVTFYLAATESLLGRPARGAEWERRIVERAESNVHPFSKAVGLCFAALNATLRRDPTFANTQLVHACQISNEYGFHECTGWGKMFGGWAHFTLGERALGIVEMKEAFDDLPAVGSLIVSRWRLALLAECQTELGSYDAAEATITQAFDELEQTSEPWCEPEVYRVAAEVALRKPGGDVAIAEERLRQAIKTARRQEAKLWELRAARSLAKLLRDTGRRDEARRMLAEIYGWFTEGFDTPDLKDAKALLEELS
jgi:predicted ATPase